MDPEREQLRTPVGPGRRRVQEGDGRDRQHRRAAARDVLQRRVGSAGRRHRSGPGLQPGDLPAVHGRPAQQVPEPAQSVRGRPQKLALGVRPVGLLGEGHRGARRQGELRLGAIQSRRHCHVLQQERLQAGRDHRADQHLLAADRRLRGTREGWVHADGDGQLRDRNRTSPTGRSSISSSRSSSAS